jgi:putative Ca2+/H+ antiporter (TMEM165/GDT1 family)
VNLAVIGAVFAVIFVGELPDKTMVAVLVMSTRGRAFAVWLGAAGAFAVHVVIAVAGGRWLGRVSDVVLIRARTAVLLAGLGAYAGLAALS